MFSEFSQEVIVHFVYIGGFLLYKINMLASCVVDCVFERRRVEPKTKNVVFCFSAKNAVLIIRIKS